MDACFKKKSIYMYYFARRPSIYDPSSIKSESMGWTVVRRPCDSSKSSLNPSSLVSPALSIYMCVYI